ncbi:MAG: hypothetical protein KKC77_14150 [Proteobacteria bacterium]|nr:hypothetical protein [Pseudomonadota bacterium]MBU1234029.1 hypothetical protein [Pseudomonadota bacterium]
MNKLQLNYIAQFILASSAGICFLTRELWLIIPMLASFIYMKTNKPKKEDDKEKLEDFSIKVFAGSILVPIGIIFFALVTLFAYVIIRKNI